MFNQTNFQLLVVQMVCPPLRDVIQRVATGETTAYGTVELDVYGTVEKYTGKYPSCRTLAHDLNRLVEVVINNCGKDYNRAVP